MRRINHKKAVGWNHQVLYFKAVACGSDHTHHVPVFMNDHFISIKPERMFLLSLLFFTNTYGGKHGCMRCAGSVFPSPVYFITAFNFFGNTRRMAAPSQAYV